MTHQSNGGTNDSLNPFEPAPNFDDSSSPLAGVHFHCLLCSSALGAHNLTPTVLCCGARAKGHAGVCLKCFSNPYAKKEPWPLVQLAALEQGWSKPSAHKEEFGEGLPAVLNGSVVAYVTYGTNDRAGSLICTECWSNGKRAEHDKQPSAFHSSPSNNLDALLAEFDPY